MNVSEPSGIQTPSLTFQTHQDSLDYADHLVEDSRRWLAFNNLNFAER